MTKFVEINTDIFNADKIQALIRKDGKNCLGNDSGVYILEIHMEGGRGSMSKAYSSKKVRDEDFLQARKQLKEIKTETPGAATPRESGK